jgi:hypothetical protein
VPPIYIAAHFLLAVVAAAAAARLPAGSWAGRAFGLGLALLVAAGLVVERRTDLAWQAMLLRWPDLVFFTNLSLAGAGAVVVLLWRKLGAPQTRWRALLLSTASLAVSLWSYGWYFAPLPPGLSGRVDDTGYCRQTTDDSCSAAAAAMLLHHHGIPAEEPEMARLCLTRQGKGTSPLGLFRGVALKARAHGASPRLEMPGDLRRLSRLPLPAVISVGVATNAPVEVQERMAGYGWSRGLRHAVVVLAADPAGEWLEVADPSYGRERWPAEGIEWLWDGQALVLSEG